MEILDDIKRFYTPRDRRPIYEWAQDSVTLPASLARHGRFNAEQSRHFLAPLDALKNPRVREVNILAPPRAGKNVIADLFVGNAVSTDSDPTLFVICSSQDVTTKYAKNRIIPILKSIAGVRAKLPFNRHNDTTCEIIFNDGIPFSICGPALSNLQSRGFRYLILDELWMMAKEHPGRIFEARARLDDYVKLHNSKLLCISQGGTKGDDWGVQFESGALHEWAVPCGGCGKHFVPEWSIRRSDGSFAGMRYENVKDERERRDKARAMETARYECPACGHAHVDGARTKEAWNNSGRYESADPSAPRVSFHWNNLIVHPWADMVEKWVVAQNAYDEGYHEPLISFYQKDLAKMYDPEKAAVIYQLPVVEIVSPPVESKKFWEKQDAIFFSVDVQRDHFWGLVMAWSKQGEFCVLWFGKLFSWADVAKKQREYFINTQGVGVDCNDGPRFMEILQQCAVNGEPGNPAKAAWWNRSWRAWWALRGADRRSFPDSSRIDKKTGEHPTLPYSWEPTPGDPIQGLHSDDPLRSRLRGKNVPIITWSNPSIKGIAQRRRDDMMKKHRGFVVAANWNDEFSAHLYSEKLEQSKKNQNEWRFVQIGKRPNHGWDCFCMNLTLACMNGCLGDVVAAEG